MGEYDVIVIGAGAAGLAAGERLAASGLSFAVLEAKERVGGRAWTDRHVFGGIPFDRGCHWLHSASRNPFRAAADRLGMRYMVRSTRRSADLFLGTQKADEQTAREAWNAVEAAFEAAAAAPGEPDRPAIAGCDTSGPWWRLARHWLTLLSALPPERISALDLAAYADTYENWPVSDGYGALVARTSAHVPVHLGVEVRSIDMRDTPIRIETNRGTLRAGHVILTVSTNVIASGAIRFLPDLPADVSEAAAGCPTGLAEKVAFLLDAPLAEFGENVYVDTLDPDRPDRPPVNFVANHLGWPLVVGQLCGETAEALEGEGEAAMTAFALEALKDMLGSGIAKRVRTATATHWGSDPHVLGAYSCATPGHAGARAVLRRPVGERLFIAGEAVSETAFSTAHGARETGLAAAAQAIAART